MTTDIARSCSLQSRVSTELNVNP